ncbi:unnamed protein product [Effrenium voratum]|uniref:Pentatricopeptide repeat-containing protein, chloroplastic n=1 Tax=Effrenium voratum TaxID=2562239 RepID=A0AA36J7S0_9DINO|nr:unnamed protein product [Effrenium voratum]
MEENGVQQSAICCNAAISACDRAGQWQQALTLLYRSLLCFVKTVLFCYNSAISACARAAEWQLSVILLAELGELQLKPTEMNYNSAINACEKGGEWELALALLHEMPLQRLPLSAWSFSTAISACEYASLWQPALAFLNRMRSAAPDLVSWTAAMSTCAKAAQWEASLLLLAEIPARDAYCFNVAVGACEKSSRWEMALSVLGMMDAKTVSPGLITYNAALASCKKGGNWEVALQLWQSLHESGFVPDVISFNCAIGASHMASRWALAMHFFGLMSPDLPDRSTFTEVANACEKVGEWTSSLHVFASALAARVIPDGTCAGSVAGALRSAGDEGGAMQLLREMLARWPEYDPETDRSIWAASQGTMLARAPGVVAISKPSGISTEMLLESWLGSSWNKRVQTVSRLDYPTSGVLPIATGPENSIQCHWLQAQFAAKLVRKDWLRQVGFEATLSTYAWQRDHSWASLVSAGL